MKYVSCRETVVATVTAAITILAQQAAATPMGVLTEDGGTFTWTLRGGLPDGHIH